MSILVVAICLGYKNIIHKHGKHIFLYQKVQKPPFIVSLLLINKILMSQIRNKRKHCQVGCKQHVFDIFKRSDESKYDITLTFCPKYQRQPLPMQPTCPIYNADNLYYTSAFILGVDRKLLQENLHQQFTNHQKIVKQSLQKPMKIGFPRPRIKPDKIPNCHLCKQQYMDYAEHIQSQHHKQNIKQNVYNGYILQLCEKYRNLWDGAQQRADLMSFDSLSEQQQDSQFLQYQSDNSNQQNNEKVDDQVTNSIEVRNGFNNNNIGKKGDLKKQQLQQKKQTKNIIYFKDIDFKRTFADDLSDIFKKKNESNRKNQRLAKAQQQQQQQQIANKKIKKIVVNNSKVPFEQQEKKLDKDQLHNLLDRYINYNSQH